MLKLDKDKLIPWLAVGFSGLLLGVLGRHIALRQSGDSGTANLTFVIVLAGVVFLYWLFLTLWESVQQLIANKRRPDELPEPDSKMGNEDSGEEETLSMIETPPTPQRPDWVEVREREFREQFELFREYVRFAMEPHLSTQELARLEGYVELFAREESLPKDITPIKPARLKNPDLYHFGWNMQNYFAVGKREEVVPWLQRVFAPLRDLEFSTIKGKLHDPQTRRHTIPNIDNITKFMAERRA